MRWLLAVTLTLLVALHAPRAHAHGMRSAYLEVTEIAPGRAVVRLRTPVAGAVLRLVAPAGCVVRPSEDAARPGEQLLSMECDRPLAGETLGVDGMGPLVSETVAWVASNDGASSSSLVTAASPSFTVPRNESALGVARQYVALGVLHIAGGVDHLLFLLALALGLRRVRAVLIAETAFTVSHTLSFTATALEWVHLSSIAAEACIALSLVLVAGAVRPQGDREPDVVRGAALAFVFGLVHGLGFAGGLAEIGLPSRAIPPALVGFAAGVEIGQVAFLAIVLASMAVVARAAQGRFRPFAFTAGAYAVGTAGFFLLLDRLSSFESFDWFDRFTR